MTLLTRKKAIIDRVEKISRGVQIRSWWAEAAAPDAREQFAQLARERNREREHQANVKGMRSLYTQGQTRGQRLD